MSPIRLTITAVKGSDGCITHYVGTLVDITERKAAEANIENLAFYDPLTHCPIGGSSWTGYNRRW